jgi:hypothetical protein
MSRRLVLALQACVLALLAGCAALDQRADQIVTREPGDARLGAPRPAAPREKEDRDFAWLAAAAYHRTPAGAAQASAVGTSGTAQNCPTPEAALDSLKWEPWPGFPDVDLAAAIAAYHLRVEVRFHRDPPAVAVAFGGTVLGNENDFLSNVRWFLPKAFIGNHPDEYTNVVQKFAPAFAEEFRRRLSDPDPDWSFLPASKLFATGHSLGGGLAQQFAYSLPMDAPRKVSKVYAFDPSPITGFDSVDESLREHNRKDLEIDRIYERGEVLALLRSLTSFVKPPTARDAAIRGVRYALFYPATPVGGHSITHLACGIERDQVSASTR